MPRERQFEDTDNALITDDPTHPAYLDALAVALDGAHKGKMQEDNYRVRYRTNGWDIFHFGYRNRKVTSAENIQKNAYAEIVVKGAHGNTRVHFSQEDSFHILNAVREKDRSMRLFFKPKRLENKKTPLKTDQNAETPTCPF